MTPIAVTQTSATVWTAASYVRDEMVLVDRLPMIPGTDYTASVVAGVTVLTFTSPTPTGAVVTLFGNVLQTIGTGLNQYETVATLISRAAKQLGLVSSAIADPFASSDPNIVQLLEFLGDAGREMAKYRDWQHLQKEYTFSTVASQAAYDLPADFRKLVDDTMWNRSTRYRIGPTNGQGWQRIKALVVASTIWLQCRVWLGQLYFSPTPGSAQTIAFEYQASSWVARAGQTQATTDDPTAATDVIYFDPRLVVTRLKRDFRQNKKQDSIIEERDYQTALSDAENEDAQAETIYLGNGHRRVHRLNSMNIPDSLT